MSRNHEYRTPEEGNLHGNDHDSDLDLDLEELDPQITTLNGESSTSESWKKGGSREQGNIPLRNLRFGGRTGYRRTHHTDAEDTDDLEALVGGDEDKETRGSGTNRVDGDDDIPFPRSQATTRSASTASHGILSRLKSLFVPGDDPLSSPTEPLDDADEDHNPATNRTVDVGQRQNVRFPPNAVSNAKYTPWSFLPRTLYQEFSFFFNMYFLLVALSQIIPALRIGYLSTYIVPLAFVLAITLGKEAIDDVGRRKRDNEANSERFTVLQLEDASRVGGVGRFKKNVLRKRTPEQQRTQEASEYEAEDGRPTDEEAIAAHETSKPSRDLKIGDVLVMYKNQRFPADVVILKSFSSEAANAASEKFQDDPPESAASADGQLIETGTSSLPNDSMDYVVNETTTQDPSAGGEAFIRTDQLDGETDWKLRIAAQLAQNLSIEDYTRLRVTAGKPDKKVNEFVGTLELLPPKTGMYDPYDGKDVDATRTALANNSSEEPKSQPLSIDNVAWANTVLASSSTVLAVVIYTGSQTRAALSTSPSRSKTGLLEYEINSLTKILCFLTLALSVILVALEGFESKDDRPWYVACMRFLILFSTIVPISLRVNLDMGKTVYAWFIERDLGIPDTVVRTSTIPEDLGRIEYLLTDKTGTLTQNEMELKKIHVGTVSYANEAMDEVLTYVKQAFSNLPAGTLFTPSTQFGTATTSGTRSRREIGMRVRDLVLALAVCHNVTPTIEEVDGEDVTSYQASSPDEIAIVKWTEQVGLQLVHRDRRSITLQFAQRGQTVVKVRILNIFPFTSDSKRMGIIAKFLSNESDTEDGEICFFQKGADTVMTTIVAANDWLDEETANMAREGLRTLVVGRRPLTAQQYSSFVSELQEASLSLNNRDNNMARVVKKHLEHDLELLGVTGVEDKLQDRIKPSLELLRNAGIKIWMLTGDKVETARCVGISSKLISRGQYIHTIAGLKRKEAALDALSILHSQTNACLLIDGQSLSIFLTHHREDFISTAVRLPAVIACRCSPTQKADVAKLIRSYTGKRTACIGDGGNDVSMIQAADVGVGIVGKEGRQASLAADFSITQFSHLTKLLVWHGRNSYKRSAKLAQFVIHRGLLISVAQTVFSVASHFEPIALYRDWLLVGYATLYTMMPVFSLVLDRDVDEGLANLYPELYKELTLGRSLSYRSFFIWVGISIYQGVVIQGASQLLVPEFYEAIPDTADPGKDETGFRQMVAVSYSVLVINELIMVAAEVTTWHPVMIFSLLGTAGIYCGSVPLLGEYFDLSFVISVGFLWRVAAISVASLGPVWIGKVIRRRVKPPSYRKVRGV